MHEYILNFHSIPQIVYAQNYAAEQFELNHPPIENQLDIYYLRQGEALLSIGGETHRLPPHSLVLTIHDEDLRFECSDSLEYAIIGFRAEFELEGRNGLLLPTSLNCETAENPILNLIDQLILKYNRDPSDSAISALTFCLLGEISRFYQTKKQRQQTYGQEMYAYRARQYILSSLSDSISVSLIAEQLGISSGYLSHIFTKDTGMTVTQYINTVRISRIEELVKNCGLDIKEAGKQVGLNDPSYISRLFKKLRGYSLTEFLQNNRKQNPSSPKRRTRATSILSPVKDKDDALLPAKFWYEPVSEKGYCRFANKNRQFQGIPTIERTEAGRTFLAFYGGMTCEESGNFVMLYYSDENMQSFGEPYLVIEAPTPECRTFDACLWVDPNKRLWLFYTQSYTYLDDRFGVWASVCEDPDSDKPTFSSPRRIANGVMLNKPTVLSSGEWLLCCALWNDERSGINDLPEEHYSNVYCSSDNGQTFRRIGYSDYAERSTDEHMIVELNGGKLWMLIRGKHELGQAFSDDGGYTWYDVGHSGIQTPCSRFHIRRLNSGRLLLINHHNFTGQDPDNVVAGKGRNHLTALLSEDEGKTWCASLELDPRDEVSYPDMKQDSDDRIYIVYDRKRYSACEILAACITEADILAGTLVTEDSYLQKVLFGKNLI